MSSKNTSYIPINKVYFKNKHEFINNNNGVLIFEKVNNKIHHHIINVLHDILITDLINVINLYVNDIYEVEYNVTTFTEDYNSLQLTNDNLDINYQISYSKYVTADRTWINSDILDVTVFSWDINTLDMNDIYIDTLLFLTDYYNLYYDNTPQNRLHKIAHSTYMKHHFVTKLTESIYGNITYKVLDHKKLKLHIIILKLIIKASTKYKPYVTQQGLF